MQNTCRVASWWVCGRKGPCQNGKAAWCISVLAAQTVSGKEGATSEKEGMEEEKSR